MFIKGDKVVIVKQTKDCADAFSIGEITEVIRTRPKDGRVQCKTGCWRQEWWVDNECIQLIGLENV